MGAPRRTESSLIAVAVLVLVAVRSVVAAHFGITDDEAYYRMWSLAPAASYFDHPPMVAWWIAAGRWLGGDTTLGVRLPQIVAFGVGSLIFWRVATLLFGTRIAAVATAFTLAMPLLSAGGVVITPDGPTVLCWATALWALAMLVRTGDANWWLLVGLICGLGLLSKYTNLFLGASVVLWLVVVPAERRWFASWQLWAGGAIALLCAIPVIGWNAAHGWPSFAKQFGRVAQGDVLTARYILEMVGGYFALASPVIAGLSIFGIYHMLRNSLIERRSPETLVLALLAPALIFFAVHAIHSRVQVNWLAPLYPLLALTAAYGVDALSSERWRAIISASAIAIGAAMSALVFAHALSPIDAGMLGRDLTAQARGWPRFAAEIDRVRRRAGAEWIATSSYATAAQLSFALRAGPPVLQLNEPIRYVHLPPPAEELQTLPALYVELQRRANLELLKKRFATIERLASVERRQDDGRSVATYAIYRVAGRLPNSSSNEPSDDVGALGIRLHP